MKARRPSARAETPPGGSETSGVFAAAPHGRRRFVLGGLSATAVSGWPFGGAAHGRLARTWSLRKGTSALATGYSRFDEIAGGIAPGELTLVAGRPGMGKTSFALNVARHAVRQGAMVLFFSLEQPADQLVGPTMDGNLIPVVPPAEQPGPRRRLSLDHLLWPRREVPLAIDDTAALALTELTAKARAVDRKSDSCLLIVDYLQLMRSGARHDSREEELHAITAGLQSLARELHVSLLALSQLGRLSVRPHGHGRPQPLDLSQLSFSEQHCDAIWFIHRPCVYSRIACELAPEMAVAKPRTCMAGTWIRLSKA